MWVFKHVCPHRPCVCVLRNTQQRFFVCAMCVDSDIVHRVSRALEYAGCLCCPSAYSAFLALSYNGALEHCDVIKPFKLLQLEFQLSGKTPILVWDTWHKIHRWRISEDWEHPSKRWQLILRCLCSLSFLPVKDCVYRALLCSVARSNHRKYFFFFAPVFSVPQSDLT